MPDRPTLLLVTPYAADANNGNWRTAARWARLLAPWYRVRLQAPGDPVVGAGRERAVALIALHARRSRGAIMAWTQRRPDAALLVALTGTDLYKDLPAGDTDTAASIAVADRLIALQDDAPAHLPAAARARTDVVFQSARALKPWPGKRTDRLHCLLVAHLREEKDPRTVFEAWRALPPALPATLSVIGAPLDAALGAAARALAQADPRVRVLGARPHGWTRQAIKRAHLLLVPSRMEGGANVVVEAVTSGTPVLGSRISGNVGMLGLDYPGWFDVGDATGLATLVRRAHGDRAFLAGLAAACARRAPRFEPAAESAGLHVSVERARVAANRRAGRMTDPDLAAPSAAPARSPAR
jgi:putative glycosyltransferase (TIGR04348 family)